MPVVSEVFQIPSYRRSANSVNSSGLWCLYWQCHWWMTPVVILMFPQSFVQVRRRDVGFPSAVSGMSNGFKKRRQDMEFFFILILAQISSRMNLDYKHSECMMRINMLERKTKIQQLSVLLRLHWVNIDCIFLLIILGFSIAYEQFCFITAIKQFKVLSQVRLMIYLTLRILGCFVFCFLVFLSCVVTV